MSDFLLTIITVTKNCAATIGRTLDSVQAIKGAVIEYVVVDGVSTDGTLKILEHNSILIDQLISEPDSGIYNAMNKGVALARGDYVLFINGDDELVADGFPEIMSILKKKRDSIVCAATLLKEGEFPGETLVAAPWRLPFFNSIPHPSSFVARNLLIRFPFREDLRIASDYDFFLKAFLARYHFRIFPVVTALHQRGGASGNVSLSLAELDQVRRQNLGWCYPVANVIAGAYRLCRKPFG